MSPRTRDWIIATSYVALIYLTLEVVRLPLSYLRAHGLLRITIFALFLLTVATALKFLSENHPKNLSRLFCLLALFTTYYLFTRTIKLPEEQLHFFEYGLVGIFFYRALSHHALKIPTLWIGAWLISSLAGLCDELLQGITPNRHYDLRDVRMNAAAAGLGLVLYFICKKSNSRR